MNYTLLFYILYKYCFNMFLFIKTIAWITYAQELNSLILSHTNKYPWFVLGIFLFILSTVFSFLLTSYIGLYGVFVLNGITLFTMWFTFAKAFYLIFGKSKYFYIEIGQWMFLNAHYKIPFSLFLDHISISFSFLTLTIGLFVYIYTFSYFRFEPLVERLLLFINSFIISMVILVSAGNLIVLFLGWELIGITSFFLINFWSSRIGTLKAAFKAYSFNKFSDVCLFIAVILLFNLTYSLDILTINNSIHLYTQFVVSISGFSIYYIDCICLGFIGAAFIKSAQLGMHIWLPDSMEAPVPASALIHSATLVSAGIFLLLRFTPLYQLSVPSCYIIIIVGSATAMYGGLVSAHQSDLKKILAYSTISHCGFLMVIYTTFVVEYTILYLYIHGFFKAIVFLSVGNIIRFNRNVQDFKRMGGLYKYLPFDSVVCAMGLINLSGLPFSYGYYIKHFLFVGLYVNVTIYWIIWALLVIGALSGIFYSSRLYYYSFFDFKKGKKCHYTQPSRITLYSNYYSNSSILGNFAILGLYLTAYITNICVFNWTLNQKIVTYVNFDSEISILNYSLISESALFILNAGVLNLLVLFALVILSVTKWRYTPTHNYSISQISCFTTISIFTFGFLAIIL